MRYRPESSVTTTRAFSMSEALLASTVTFGSAAPAESPTRPVTAAWPNAVDGASRHTKTRGAFIYLPSPAREETTTIANRFTRFTLAICTVGRTGGSTSARNDTAQLASGRTGLHNP